MKEGTLMIKEVEKEFWKTYPEFDWIQASNIGRYRTITREIIYKNGRKHTVKGHILTPYRTKTGYLQLGFGVNGKSFHRLAHRVTAATFIPNPKNLPQVNHKNCIRNDNRIENLEWCTLQYNNAYKEKYGTSASEAVGRPLWVFVLKTGKKQYFSTQMEAGRKTGIDFRNINAVIKGKKQQSGGYFFAEHEDEITDEKIQSIKDNMRYWGGVIAIDTREQEPLYFESQEEAALRIKCSRSHIGSVLRGHRNHTGGFWFCHADENAVEATRAKFGDEVANKVAKLMSESILV